MNISLGITSETLSTLSVLSTLELKQWILPLTLAFVRSNFLKIIFNINIEFRNMNYFTLTSLLLFSFEKQAFDVNIKILNLTIKFLLDSDRFDKPLIWLYREIWVLSDVSHIFEFIIIWCSIILFFLNCFYYYSLQIPKIVTHLYFDLWYLKL